MFVVSQFILNKSGICKNQQLYSIALGLILYSSVYLYILFYNNEYLNIFNNFIMYIVIIDLLLSAFYYFSIQNTHSIDLIEANEDNEDDEDDEEENEEENENEDDSDGEDLASSEFINNLIHQARSSKHQAQNDDEQHEQQHDEQHEQINDLDNQNDDEQINDLTELCDEERIAPEVIKNKKIRKSKKIISII